LWAVIMTAYVTGTSTRKVDDLVKALGCDSGVSRSTVSRICKDIDADVAVLRTRTLGHQPFVYVWLDATYVHVREHRHVVSKAVVIATGLRQDGRREVLGVDIGDSENETFWSEFLGGLNDRGLTGVKLVISDAHAGLVKAIGRSFQGSTWQRCRVHAMRNMLSAAPHPQRQLIASLIRTIFVQPDHDRAVIQLRAVVDQLEPTAPGVAKRLADMEADLLAYTGFPPAHWSKIWSNNPIERLNRELKRRTDVVGIFPDTASVIRLVGALLVEINDEMIAADRRYIAAASVAEIDGIQPELQSLPAAPRD
jgi:transposase-like protein